MRQRSADDYGAIRQRQEDLFGRAPVGEAHVNVPFVPEAVAADQRNAEGKWPCFCGTTAASDRRYCLTSKDSLASQYYCTGRLPKENAP